MRELWRLFRTFFGMGAITFGGGYAMLPLLQRTVVEKYHWATEEELLDYYAIGQCTPGIIAVNTSTFIGYKRRGVVGAIVATLGMVMPSLIIITLIAALLDNFMDIVWVQHAFAGIRVAVAAMIVTTVVGLAKKNVRGWKQWMFCCAAFVLTAFGDVSVVIVVVAAAVIGMLLGERMSCK